MIDRRTSAPETLRIPADARIALVHDWLTGMRGGEKILEVLCELFPRAELFTLVHLPGSVSPAIERLRIHRSFVSRLPRAGRWYRHYLPLFPTAVEQFNLDRFDFVLSTSHCAVKSVLKGSGARHLCYCMTPMRYAWDQFDAYFGADRLGGVRSGLLRPVLGRLARWDSDTSARADRYVAISQYVARRIRRYYNRQAGVIYPPVDTQFYRPDDSQPDGSALIVSALVPYKRVDIAIEACRLAGIRLRVVGQGPELLKLRRMAGPHVEFLGTLSDDEIRGCYRQASVTLLPGEEDFGIVPLEAHACGRPVVAVGRGGALETVIDGKTGVLVSDSSPGAFAEGIARALRTPFEPAEIRRHAERFGRDRFAAELAGIVSETFNAPSGAMTW